MHLEPHKIVHREGRQQTKYSTINITMIRVSCISVHINNGESYYNSSNVCVFVCSLSPPRSFGGSSPNLVGVCTWTSHLPLRGSFPQKVNGSLSLSTVLYMRQPNATQLQKAPFALLLLLQSLIRRLLLHCISTGNCLVVIKLVIVKEIYEHCPLKMIKVLVIFFPQSIITCIC